MMKPKKFVTLLAIIIIVLLLLFFVKLELKVSADCQILPLKSFVLKTNSLGYIQGELSIAGKEEKEVVNLLKLVSSDYTAVNLESTVKQGERVKKGDTLALVSSTEYETELKKTQAELSQAQANHQLLKKGAQIEEINRARELVEKTQAEFNNKEKEYSRAKKLFEQKLISDEEFEKIQTDHTVLSKELEIAKNSLRLLERGTRKENLQIAKDEIEKLKAKIDFLKSQISASVIKSPINGVVTSTSREGILLSIANLDSVQVMIRVKEKDLDVIREGHKVKTKVRSYPWEAFYGEVSKVAFQVEENQARNIFWVTSRIENKENLLKPGMTGFSKIYCGRRSLISLLGRGIVRFFRIEVWSWW